MSTLLGKILNHLHPQGTKLQLAVDQLNMLLSEKIINK